MKSLMQISWTLFLVVCALNANARVEATIGPVPVDQNPNLAITLPVTPNSEILISRDQYLISYNKNRRAPNWVAWKLEANQVGTTGRTNKFAQDTDLQTYLTSAGGGFKAVQGTDFTNSCFDRGHQIPSADRTDTTQNNETTFLMSNMIPQTPYLNRGMWEHLEAYTRSLVLQQGKTVYVIDGPIYDQNFGSIGPNRDIPIPSKNFKVVIILDKGQTAADINSSTPMITVIMPNILNGGAIPVPYTANCGGANAGVSSNQDDWKQYQTTLKNIESLSDISFQNL